MYDFVTLTLLKMTDLDLSAIPVYDRSNGFGSIRWCTALSNDIILIF
jgi:hypothetical protein